MSRQQNTAVDYFPTRQETIPDNVTVIDVLKDNIKNGVTRLCNGFQQDNRNFEVPKMIPEDEQNYGHLENKYLIDSVESIKSEYYAISHNEFIYGKERRERLALLRIAYHEKIKNTSEKR